MKVKSKIMAIDPSLTGFAVCILDETGNDVYQEEIATKPTKSLQERINRMTGLATKSLDLATKFSPEVILIEGYAFNARGSSGISLGELGMLVRYFLKDASEVFLEVPPTTLKKFITGKGNASKVEVASSLSSKFNKIFKSDNAADAYGLAQLGLAMFIDSDLLTKYQREAVGIIKEML